jgi:hypothetical protein
MVWSSPQVYRQQRDPHCMCPAVARNMQRRIRWDGRGCGVWVWVWLMESTYWPSFDLSMNLCARSYSPVRMHKRRLKTVAVALRNRNFPHCPCALVPCSLVSHTRLHHSTRNSEQPACRELISTGYIQSVWNSSHFPCGIIRIHSFLFFIWLTTLQQTRHPLWSSGQSSWLERQKFQVWFHALPHFLTCSGSENCFILKEWCLLGCYAVWLL